MLTGECSGDVDFEFWRPMNNEVDQVFGGRVSWRWNLLAEDFWESCIMKAPQRPQMMLDPVPRPDIPDWAVACSCRKVSDDTGSMSSWPCWIARRTDLLFIQLIEEESSRRTVGSLSNGKSQTSCNLYHRNGTNESSSCRRANHAWLTAVMRGRVLDFWRSSRM